MDSRISMIEKKIPENKNELSNPVNNENLWTEVAKLGSNYNELSDSVKSLKDTTNSLQSYHTELKANITSINVCSIYFLCVNRTTVYVFYLITG